MYLRSFVPDTAARLEIMAVLYLCYGRWATSCLLLRLREHLHEFAEADDGRRADILSEAWEAMEAEYADYQVVARRSLWRVELRTRGEAPKLGGVGAAGVFS